MSRDDNRDDDELRPLKIVYERLDRVDGSARFGFGQTQSLVSVSGPIEARINSESPSHATLDIHIRPLANASGTDEKALAAVVKSILTPTLLLTHNPRTLVQVVGQALCGNDSGSGMGSIGRGWNASLVASLINAINAAFLSAGSVAMKGVVCAVAVGRVSNVATNSSRLILDPSETELASLTGGGCFAFFFSTLTVDHSSPVPTDVVNGSLVWANYAAVASGYDQSELLKATELAKTGAIEVWRRLKESVIELESHSVGPGPVPLKRRKAKGSTKEQEIDDDKMEI